MTPAWRRRSLRWLVRHESELTCSKGKETYPSTFLWVWAGETANSFEVIAIVALSVVLVAVHPSVTRILWRFDKACLVVEHDFSHPLQGNLHSFAVLYHVIHFIEPRHRLRSHANPLSLVSSLPVDFTKIRDSA